MCGLVQQQVAKQQCPTLNHQPTDTAAMSVTAPNRQTPAAELY